jgi:hypothetical protein
MSDRAYDVHPGVAMMRKWADDLPAKTGRTLEEWAEAARECELEKPSERAAWMARTYGLATNTAWHIAEYAADSQTWDGDPRAYLRNAAGYVEAMFAGGKAGLRPIFERLTAAARDLGTDVKVCPCKTMIPFYRTRVFAEVRPATKTRLELALALGEGPFKGRLRTNPRARGNDRLRHLVELTRAGEVDAAVRKWLRAAYDADA